MNKNENRSGWMNATPRRNLTAMLILVLLLLVALVIVQATGPRQGNESNISQQALQSQPQRERTGHSDYLTSLTQKGMKEGLGQDSVMLLQLERGPGRDVVAKDLRAMLMQSGDKFGKRLAVPDLKETAYDKRILSYAGERSYLEIYTDGTKFRFRSDLDDPKVTEQAGKYQKLDKAELETMGRRFIGEALGRVVRLGPNEALTFLGVRYLRHGGGDGEGKNSIRDAVIANIAVFGREVNGVPVVGSGSKVAVWFAGDRQPVGFDVDWPVYKVTQTPQRLLPQEKLKARVEAVTTFPKYSSQSRVTRFECGYVDLGATKRSSQLQAGCSVSYDGRSAPYKGKGETLQWARIEFVPAGVRVLRDPKWPLANLIASGKEPTARSMESITLGTAPDPGADPSKDEGKPYDPARPKP